MPDSGQDTYKAFFDASSEAVLVLNSGMFCIDLNFAASELLGKSREALIGSPLQNISDFQGDIADDGFLRLKTGKKNEHVLSYRTIPVSSSGMTMLIIETKSDIRGHVTVNHGNVYRNDPIRIVLDLTGQLMYDYDIKTGLIQWTGKIEDMTGFSTEEFNSLGISGWEDCIHPDDRSRTIAQLNTSIEQKTVYISQYRFRRHDGSYFFVDDRGTTIYDADGNPLRMIGSMQDIHDRKKAEAELVMSEARLRRAELIGGTGNWEFDMVSKKVFASEGARRIYGLGEKEWSIAEVQKTPLPEYRQMLDEALRSLIDESRPYDVEFKIKRQTDGAIIDIHSCAEYDPGRNIVFGVIHDITSSKKNEENLKSSLREKEILLRELYHRTKNNMQVIASILNLNAILSPGYEVSQIVRDTVQRINAIALVHQKLYQSQDLSNILLGDYISDLVRLILEGFNRKDDKISLDFNMHVFPSVIDIAIPCGLIINELVTNTLKHGIPEGKSGTISIELSRSDDGRIRLKYSDDGNGPPDGFNYQQDGSLGLMTIRSICEHQLSGDIRFGSGKGFRVSIEFNDNVYAKRV
ncbi:MAG TPA: PAS domain-containing protein [Spirochaetota bacterium]|nr:PAS domain-containing protein [Spirochaetota bacterium]